MKKRRFLSLLIVLLTFASLHSQEKTKKDKEHYLKVLDTVKDKRTKAEALRYLIPKADNDSIFTTYSEEYVDIMMELKEYNKAAEVAVFAFYYIDQGLQDTKRAMVLINRLEEVIEHYVGNTYILGNIFLKKGGGYFSLKNYEEAIKNYTKAIENFGEKDSVYTADSYFFRGQTYFQTSRFLEAINDYTTASKYYEKLGDKEYQFYALGDIINLYGSMGFHQKAVEERKRLIEKKLQSNVTKGLDGDYYNQAISYSKLDKLSEQENALLQALKFAIKNNNRFRSRANYYAALSKFYADSDLKKAEKYLDSAESVIQKTKADLYNRTLYRLHKSYVLFKKKRYNEAVQNASKELSNAIAKNNTLTTVQLHKILHDIYEAKNDPTNALKHYKAYNHLNDSILNVTKTNALSYYQTLYETEQKESEIVAQQKDIEILNTKNTAKQRLILFGGIGLFLSFVIILLYRKRKQLQKEQKIQALYSQKLLITQEQDRKRVSKDLHDGLGHNLLIIKNRLSEKKDNETKELVAKAIEEMRTISRGLHPYQLDDLGLSRALQNLIAQLDQNYEDTYIFGEIENIDHGINPTQGLNIFRIVQECLSNIVKHANAISAEVSLRMKNDKILLRIIDNGKGFNFSEKYNDFKTLGLKTIEERVRFLKGTMHVKSDGNEGTVYSIEIPNT